MYPGLYPQRPIGAIELPAKSYLAPRFSYISPLMSPKARRQLPKALYHPLPLPPLPCPQPHPPPSQSQERRRSRRRLGRPQLAEEAKEAITAAEGAAGTGRHRLLKEGSEGFTGALGRLVGHCSISATCGGWESAQKAQDATDAANDLGVDVTNCKNK